MKHILTALMILFPLFLGTSCGNDIPQPDVQPGTPRPFTFKAQINDYTPDGPQTKVDVAQCQFTHGDEIGLYMVYREEGKPILWGPASRSVIYKNEKLTYDTLGNARAWIADKPTLAPPPGTYGTYVVEVYAYYPYQPGIDPSNVFVTTKSGQNNWNAHSQSSFMTARTTIRERGQTEVLLQFQHRTALFEMQFRTRKGTPYPISISFIDQTLTACESKSFNLIEFIENSTYALEKGQSTSTGASMYRTKTEEVGDSIHTSFQMAVIPAKLSIPGNKKIHYVDNNRVTAFMQVTDPLSIDLVAGKKSTMLLTLNKK